MYPLGQLYGCVVKKKVIYMEEENRDTTDFGKMWYHCLDFICDLSLNVPQDITKKNKALKDIPEFVGASECT